MFCMTVNGMVVLFLFFFNVGPKQLTKNNHY